METTSLSPRRTWRPWFSSAGVAVLALAVAASAARADRLRTRAGIGLVGKVVGLGAEGLVFKQAGSQRTIPLGDIASVEVDGLPALTKAEEAFAKAVEGGPGADAAFAEAERLYRSLLRPGGPPWLETLVHVRLYKVFADSGRTKEALDAYLEMAAKDSQRWLIVDATAPRKVISSRIWEHVEGVLRR